MLRADEDEYRQFVVARLEPLRRMAFLLCRNWHTADDLVSITFGKLYRRWGRARDMENLDAYVRAILTHAWLDERRRPWRREDATDPVPESVAPGGEPPDVAMLRRLLAAVPPRQRAVIVGRPAPGGHTPPLGVPVASATAPGVSVTPPPTPGQTTYPPFVGPPVTEPSPAARQRLEAAMRHAVLAVAPAASFRTGNGASGFDMRHVDQPIAGTPPGNIPSFTYSGTTVVRVGIRQGDLSILVARAGPFREGCGGVPGVATCEPVTGPRGETGFLMSQVLDPSDRLEAQYHLWLDRSGVDAGTITVDLMVNAPAGGQPDPPLTADQLVHIAEDPALTLYP